jgi:hypothetical protein
VPLVLIIHSYSIPQNNTVCKDRGPFISRLKPGAFWPISVITARNIEAVIWEKVERYCRNPQAAIEELRTRLYIQRDASDQFYAEIARLQKLLLSKQHEKDTVIALFRKGRIDSADLDRQLDQVQTEEDVIKEEIEQLSAKVQSNQQIEAELYSAEQLLKRLNGQLDNNPTFEERRNIVQKLVHRVDVLTDVHEDGSKEVRVRVFWNIQEDEVVPIRGRKAPGQQIPRSRKVATKLQRGSSSPAMPSTLSLSCPPGCRWSPASIR